MLHLVCPSPTPPSSPKPRRNHGNTPQGASAGSAVRPTHTAHTSAFTSQHIISQHATCFASFVPAPSKLWWPPHRPTRPVRSSPPQRRAQTDKCARSQPPCVFTADAKVTSPAPHQHALAFKHDDGCGAPRPRSGGAARWGQLGGGRVRPGTLCCLWPTSARVMSACCPDVTVGSRRPSAGV